MDVAMGALLLAAFLSVNVLSLLYLAFIAVGMAAPAPARRLAWRSCVLPILAVLLLAQYSLYVGPPPPLGGSGSLLGLHHRSHHPDPPSVKVRTPSRLACFRRLSAALPCVTHSY